MINAPLLWAIFSHPCNIFFVAILVFIGGCCMVVGLVLFSESRGMAIVAEVSPAIATAMYSV